MARKNKPQKSMSDVVSLLVTPAYAVQEWFPFSDVFFLCEANLQTIGHVVAYMMGPDGDVPPAPLGATQWDRITDQVINASKILGLPDDFQKQWVLSGSTEQKKSSSPIEPADPDGDSLDATPVKPTSWLKNFGQGFVDGLRNRD